MNRPRYRADLANRACQLILQLKQLINVQAWEGRDVVAFQLHGNMIPRSVKRMFDERSEERIDAESQTAILSMRGRNHIVGLVNLSRSGAMLRFTGDAHIGESVSLQLLDRGTVPVRCDG
jgi:hypothetical protein